jgi:hypothetical protein
LIIKSEKKSIKELLDVRCAVKQGILDNVKYSKDGKSLILGDINKLNAYTQSD